jgi:hypothetical protein
MFSQTIINLCTAKGIDKVELRTISKYPAKQRPVELKKAINTAKNDAMRSQRPRAVVFDVNVLDHLDNPVIADLILNNISSFLMTSGSSAFIMRVPPRKRKTGHV